MNELDKNDIIIDMLHIDATKHTIIYLIGLILNRIDYEKDGS